MIFEETSGIQHGKGIKMVIYGQEGVGKTSLAAKMPGVVFIDTEGSTSKMNVRRLPKPTSWEMLKQELEYVMQAKTEKNYKTVCIDTFDWAERLALQEICDKHNVSGIEDIGYGKGWIFEAEKIGRFLDFTEDLINAGINVVLNCHAITRKTSIPESDSDFDHWELKLGDKTTNKISPLLKEWSDITLFLAFKTNIIAVDDKGKKHKATSCKRVMYTTKTAWWDAKNRFGLSDELPLDFNSIASIFENPAVAQVINKAESAGISVNLESAQQIYPPVHESDTNPWEKPLTKEESITQSILDGIVPELAQLMAASSVKPEEIQAVVGKRGYFPSDMPVQNYPHDFVMGCLVGAWSQVFEIIKEMRKGA